MTSHQHFTSVRFSNYKALKQFSLTLGKFNILVGPNNSGKSMILGAFRILAEGIRRARSRNPALINVQGRTTRGYQIDLTDLPISTENIFTNYDDSKVASILFRLSNGNQLELTFPEVGACYMVPHTTRRPVTTTSNFRSAFPISIGFVPILGPVDHDEQLYQPEAARRALLTSRASRNFRNIWHRFPENFAEFRELVRTTWPGMDIEPPEVSYGDGKPRIYMYCPEARYPREIFWAGFGFQVWCQMLTYAIQAKKDRGFYITDFSGK